MGDANPICTLGDYSKPSHEGYRNIIELPVWNNVAISLPQDVPSTSDRRLIELKNQVQRLMEAHLAPMQPTQVNIITTSCEICSGPHDTQYYMKNPEQAFVENASSRTDEAKEGLVSNFMASQDARLSKFEADFKQQQSKMTNKIDTVSKAITDRIAGALPSNTAEEEERERKGIPNTIAYNDEQRNTPHLEWKDITANLGPNRDDEGIEWLDVGEPLDLVDTCEESVYESLIKDMPKCSLNYDFRIKNGDPRNLKIPCMIGNMSYVIDFTILGNIETNIDPSLSYVIFGRPIVEIARLAINKKHGLMTFTDETIEITFKTPYKDLERSELSSEGHDLLSSRVILSEDDYDKGCRKPSDLEEGFYRDTIKLGPEYLTGMDDEREVT
ncbi:hypothetical protein Tco_0359877 [Tanacetum coccineum]